MGKLLRNKAVDLPAAAWPIVLWRDARLVVVGFGAFAEAFDALVAALAAGESAGTPGKAKRPVPGRTSGTALRDGVASGRGKAHFAE